MKEKIQVWYKFPHEKEVWHLDGLPQADMPDNAFIMQPFEDKPALYLNAENAEIFSLTSFLTASHQPFFELTEAPKVMDIDYEKLVEKAIEHIQQGDFKKVVLARQKEVLTNVNPLETFKKLCTAYENCFVHLVYQPNQFCAIGASPELLVAATESSIESVSMAGTLTDKNIAFQRKERDEQSYVTAYILERFSAYGLKPQINPTIINNGKIQHLYSVIKSTTNQGIALGNKLLQTLHPTPAVCGSPKNESMQFITQHEGFAREWYAGYLGIINKQTIQTYVNLRCAQLFINKAILYAGAGITSESNAAAEFLETTAKMEVLERFLV